MTTTASIGTGQRTIWQIDPKHSLVELAVKHMMFTTVKGRFTGVQGTINADEANPANSTVEVTIDAATINTGADDRDNHLRSPDFLDVQSFPTITFKSTRVEPVGSDRLRVTGDLALHGVTHSVVLDAEIGGRGKTPFGTEIMAFSGQTTVNRKDFGLLWNVALESGGVLVGDTVKVLVEVEAVKQG